MEYSFLFLLYGVLLLADIAGAVFLDNCKEDTFIDIQENSKYNITCRDVDDATTIIWKIKRSNTPEFVAIATCTPFNCTLHLPGQFSVLRSPGQCQLVYTQQNRTEDFNAQILCESQSQTLGTTGNASCNLNVISDAVLSDCMVEENRHKGTLNGSCRFEHAVSDRKGFNCTWYKTKSSDQTSTEYAGVIHKKNLTFNAEVYWSGRCTLSISGQQWDDGNYSYSIDFCPGSGRLPIGNLRKASRDNNKETPCTFDIVLPLKIASWVFSAFVAINFVIVFIKAYCCPWKGCKTKTEGDDGNLVRQNSSEQSRRRGFRAELYSVEFEMSHTPCRTNVQNDLQSG